MVSICVYMIDMHWPSIPAVTETRLILSLEEFCRFYFYWIYVLIFHV